MEDYEVWDKYPHLRPWFNKLYLSEYLDYDCGPCGVAPTKSGWYVVRPIYNLGGMGAGARKVWIEAGDQRQVEPGYFWCEHFEGAQYSITYTPGESWTLDQKSCWKAVRDEKNPLYKFDRWERSDFKMPFPFMLEEAFVMQNLDCINIEVIGNKIVEVHFRDTPDPDYDILIPIWEGEEHLVDNLLNHGYNWIIAVDDSNGFLPQKRIGFMVK